MTLSPGIRFLGRTLFAPTCLFFLLQALVIHPKYGLGIPIWEAPIVAFIALVVFLLGKNILAEVSHARAANAMGARLVPRAKGTWPGSVDLLRTLLKAAGTGYLGDSFAALVLSLGSTVINIRLLWEDKIFTVSPEHIQIILATDFKNYVKGKHFCSIMDSVLGNGVFNSDGDMWSFHRTMTRPFFARDRFEHFEIFNRHTDTVISHIKNRMVEGYAVDFQDIISRLTMDSATEFLFGSCVDSLTCTPPYPHNASMKRSHHDSPPAQAANDFTEAYGEAMHQISLRQRLGWAWPLFEMFEDKTAKPMEVVTKYIDPLIEAALNKKKLAEEKGIVYSSENSCLLDELMKSTSDPKLLKDEIINILIAGRDTTMSVLTNVIYLLSSSPAVTARLREEILAVVGPTEPPTYDNIKQMKYLRAVLNETLRLFPPVPFNIRQPLNSTIWPSPDPNEKPLYIPGGTTIMYSVMLMHRRPDLWGPDAHVFDPERFLDHRVQKYISHPFKFLPFNAGPRICLGQQFAYNEMSFVIIRLLQNFASMTLDVDACPPDARVPAEWSGQPGRKGIERCVPRMHLTLYTLSGLWVKMEDAKTADA